MKIQEVFNFVKEIPNDMNEANEEQIIPGVGSVQPLMNSKNGVIMKVEWLN